MFNVGFMFTTDGTDWQGGRNYFQSLFLALQSHDACTVRPVAFVGREADLRKLGFPTNVDVVADSAFDRLSPKWLLNKLASKLSGVAWVTNRVLHRHGVQVVSHSAPSGSRSVESIGWIPDFQHLHLPQFFPQAELQARGELYCELVRKSSLIIVSSEAARKDFERFAPGFAAKARVLRFCAVTPDLEATATEDLAARYDLHSPYFYIPNQFWAHKNHFTAIRAFAQLSADYPNVKVVCSGSLADYRNPGHLEAIRSKIARLDLVDRFILLGVVPYDHIARLMLNSVAVINPSLFEGWSTSVEEAKALGVPLILSDLEVHREQCVHGEATFFDPLAPVALADRMRAVLSKSDSAPRRTSLDAALARHRERATEFARAYEFIVAELFGRPKIA